MLFDTHCHLSDPRYQLETVFKHCHEAAVSRLLAVSYSLETSRQSLAIAKRYPEEAIMVAVGIHPSEVDETADLAALEALIQTGEVVAVGEIGLDYYHPGDKEVQKRFFIAQIDLANKYNLPVLIHSREAAQDTYDILLAHPVKRGGIMHCFSYSLEMARQFIDLGYLIALGGPVTFKNGRVAAQVAKEIPLSSLVLETDAPYLAPDPYRGQLNEPSYTRIIAARIAQLRGISLEALALATTTNALRVLS